MAGRIPQNFIDDLVSRADIVEVINARVPLKKKGKEYTACCPFHNEKTPSFTVSDSKQFYHCFGCGAHGTVLGFFMEYENMDFVDAIEALATEYNLEVPRENTGFTNSPTKDDKQPLYDIIGKASKLFQQQLKTSEKAIQYLKQRGLTGDIAKKYRLGYAPEGWNFLTDKLDKDKSTVDALIATGLLVQKDGGKQYDRFRDRIIFPITDRRGQVIGFGGRVIDQGEPKYLNSPENAVFHKGLELYGLYEARKAVRKLERIIVVEGYMDVVALAQHGIEYAVASLGTATTKDQIQKVLRTVPEIIFCYDGDTAGLKAAWRALENTLPIVRDGQFVKFLFLPEKEDPDSMIRKEGKESFEQRLSNATALSDFLFDTLQQKADIKTMDGRAQLAETAKPLLAQMNDSVFKDLLLEKLSELVGMSQQKLQQRIATPDKNTHQPVSAPARRSDRHVRQNATRTAIALLLQFPELAKAKPVPEEFSSSDLEGFSLLAELHSHTTQGDEITSIALLERFRGNQYENSLLKLMEWEIPGIEDEAQRTTLFRDSINSLITKYRHQRFEDLTAKQSTQQLTAEEKQEYLSLLSD
jgi:DNA primase